MKDVKDPGIKPAAVETSVGGSIVRARVLLHLDGVGEASVSDIASAIGGCYANVYGAIKGLKGKYSEKKSLLVNGWVEARPITGNVVVYALTGKGRDEARSLRGEGSRDRNV